MIYECDQIIMNAELVENQKTKPIEFDGDIEMNLEIIRKQFACCDILILKIDDKKTVNFKLNCWYVSMQFLINN